MTNNDIRNTIHPNFEERRKYKRIPSKVRIEFEVLLDGENFGKTLSEAIGESVSINLSEGGILLCSDRDIPIGTLLELSFVLPNSDLPIYLKSKVVRSIKKSEELYEAGMEFSFVNEKDREILKHYILSCDEKMKN